MHFGGKLGPHRGRECLQGGRAGSVDHLLAGNLQWSISDYNPIQVENPGLVLSERGSILNDGFGDTVKVFDVVRFELAQHFSETVDKAGLGFPLEHVGCAKLRDDLAL